MMLTVILVTPRMSRLWWRRKGSQGSSSITASSGRRKDSQHRWRFSSPSSSGFNRPKICEHFIWCKKVRIGSRVAYEILVRVWTPHSAKPQYHYHYIHDHHHHNNDHWLHQLGAKPPYPTLARAGVRRERGQRKLEVNIHFFRTNHLLQILAAPLVKPDYETQIKIFTQNIQNILKRESVANQIPCDQGDSRNMSWILGMSKGIGLLRRPGRK